MCMVRLNFKFNFLMFFMRWAGNYCVCARRDTPSLHPPWLSEKELKLLRHILSRKGSQSHSRTSPRADTGGLGSCRTEQTVGREYSVGQMRGGAQGERNKGEKREKRKWEGERKRMIFPRTRKDTRTKHLNKSLHVVNSSATFFI